jgi:hypothetical protein
MKKVTRLELFPRPLAVLATDEECVVLDGSELATLARAVRRTAECGDDSFVELYDASTSTYYEALVGDVNDGEGTVPVIGIVLSPTLGSTRPTLRVEEPESRRLMAVYLDERRVGEVHDPATDANEDRRAAAYELGEDLRNLEADDPEACPGCGCKPGDGATEGCDDPVGCGYFRALEGENDPAE